MYALQIVQIPLPPGGGGQQQTKNLVQLVQLTFPTNPPPPPPPTPFGPGPGNQVLVTGTVLAEISDQIIAQTGGIFGTDVNSVAAADFNPSNGLLYFTATGGPGTSLCLVARHLGELERDGPRGDEEPSALTAAAGAGYELKKRARAASAATTERTNLRCMGCFLQWGSDAVRVTG